MRNLCVCDVCVCYHCITHLHFFNNSHQVSDEDIGLDDSGLFGLRPTDRTRGLRLFAGGHVVSDSFKVTSGVTRDSMKRAVWIVQGDVVASQRSRIYNVRVVYDKVTGQVLDKPFGSCECVAHLGWCSHQLALGFLFVNFLKMFKTTTASAEFRRVYPPSVFTAQQQGVPWTYATSMSTKKSVQCFDNLKWKPGKKEPKSKRDTVQLLVPRVKNWRDRWIQETDAPDRRHTFAEEEVSWVFRVR